MSVHNAERTLRQTIESVLAQTYQDFELIVIDDGSTDSSLSIMEEFSKRYPDKIVLITNSPQLGLPASLNRGIDKATGTYIIRMDADDICDKDRFERQVSFMDSHPEIGVSGTWAKILDENPAHAKRLWKNPARDIEIRTLLFFTCCLLHPTIIIRRDVLEKHGFRYDESYVSAQDYELWSRMIWHTRFANIAAPLLTYRVHAQSTTSTKATTQQENSKKIRKELLEAAGLAPTETELALHETAKATEWRDRSTFLKEKEVWLLKIKSCLEKKYGEDRATASQFAKIWLSICIENKGLGLGVWRAYWSSPLSRLTPKNLVRSISLFNDK